MRPKIVVKIDEQERFERFALFGSMASFMIVVICAIALFAWHPWNAMSQTLSAGLTPTSAASADPSPSARSDANSALVGTKAASQSAAPYAIPAH